MCLYVFTGSFSCSPPIPSPYRYSLFILLQKKHIIDLVLPLTYYVPYTFLFRFKTSTIRMFYPIFHCIISNDSNFIKHTVVLITIIVFTFCYFTTDTHVHANSLLFPIFDTIKLPVIPKEHTFSTLSFSWLP